MSGLLKHAADERDRVRAKISKAKGEIEQDIEENGGVYPYNKARVTQAELCRRAKIGMATLQGPTHKGSTRVEVNEWLAQLKLKVICGHRIVRKKVTDRSDAWQQAYQELQDGWAIAELERVEDAAHIRELEGKLADMQLELAAVREKLANLNAVPAKIVPIGRKNPHEKAR